MARALELDLTLGTPILLLPTDEIAENAEFVRVGLLAEKASELGYASQMQHMSVQRIASSTNSSLISMRASGVGCGDRFENVTRRPA